MAGTTRSPEKAAWLKGQGVEAVFWDGLDSSLRENELFYQATHILSSIAPLADSSSRGAIGDVAIQILNEMDQTPQQVRGDNWLGYLSTTGVYGDWGGAWVDELSALRGDSPRLQARIAAEAAWRARGGHVFRLAGIYGPGRNVLDEVRSGTAKRIDKPGQVFSRIHVEDIAQAVLASMQKPSPGAVYNVCDDEPAASHEVVSYACGLLGVAPPPLVPFEQAMLSPMAREFYAANRRVRNDRIKNELGVSLKYPSYREGLQAMLNMA